MKPISTDRNLLFGILAVQMDFVTRDQLLAAMQSWMLAKQQPLGQILVEQDALDAGRRDLLEALVNEHVKQHGNDARQSLSIVSSIGSLRQDLQQVADDECQMSIQHIASARDGMGDAYETVPGLAHQSGSPFGRFRILRPHARGGLGQVSVALDEELQREVALKEIQDRYADQPESRTRFMLEAQVTGGLEHPGIVPVYGLGNLGGRPFYAMRFIRGDSLKEAVDRFHRRETANDGQRTLELRKLLQRFIDVCQAVAYAHSRGVLHRDLKPGNIMLGRYGETLVVDWGLAKIGSAPGEAATKLDSEPALASRVASGTAPTLLGSVVGTPSFMSPEQAAGRLDDLGPASDTYSLGATLYYILTGKTPYDDSETGQLLKRVQQGDFLEPRRLSTAVPRPLNAICVKAMALQPGDRYASPLDLAEDLEHWLADEPVTAYSESASERLRRWSRRHRTWIRAGALTLIAITSIALFALVMVNRARHQQAQYRQQATARLGQTRRVIDELLTAVSRDLSEVPGAQPIRELLLQRAAEEYERLAADESDQPDLQFETAWAQLRLGETRLSLGHAAEAKKQMIAAEESFADLVRRHPGRHDFVEGLAASHSSRGWLLETTGKTSAAAAHLQRAVELRQDLVSSDHSLLREYLLAREQHEWADILDDPQDARQAQELQRQAIATFRKLMQQAPETAVDLPYRLAASLYSLGKIESRRGQSEAAEKLFRSALEELQPAVSVSRPHVENVKLNALIVNALGFLLLDQGQWQDAEELLRASMTDFTNLVQANPAMPAYRKLLASSYKDLANLLRQNGKNQDSLAALAVAEQELRELISSYPDRVAEREELADALIEMAMIQITLGDLDQTIVLASECAEIATGLIETNPESISYRDLLANALNHKGRALRRQGRLEEAVEVWTQASAQLKQLSSRAPDNLGIRDRTAITLANLGAVHHELGQLDPSADALTEAARQYRQLVAAHPDRPGIQERLVMTLGQLGPVLSKLDRPSEALQTMHDAIEVGTELVSEFPNPPLYRLRLAQAHMNTTIMLTEGEQDLELEQHLTKALEIYDQLCQQHPESVEYAYGRFLVFINFGLHYGQRSRYQEAVDAFQQAHEVGDFSFPLVAMSIEALALAAEGDYRQAAAAAERVQQAPDATVTDYFYVGLAWLQAAASVQRDIELSDDDSQTLRTEYLKQAHVSLQKADELGWFESSDDLDLLTTVLQETQLAKQPPFPELVDSIRRGLD